MNGKDIRILLSIVVVGILLVAALVWVLQKTH